MKKAFTLKSLLASMAIAGATSMSIAPATAQAGVSANVGYVSNYVFRGIEQTESGSASAGLDYEGESGLYAGTWVADVETGLEYDFYAGWAGDITEGVSLGVGATYYGYTESAFDDPYKEVNLSIGFGDFTIGYDKGVWMSTASGDTDYDHLYASVAFGDFGLTIAKMDGDTDTSKDALYYADLGYSFELAAGLDGAVNYVYVTPEDKNVGGIDQSFLVLGLSKSFDIM
ncbi:TorF family putative porin [Thiomicrorhabdus sp.]|uniref:TorF family putative porin n=1 Tax=Thiomicrorhabdus sp. TaxID=2039724 RepID=UPI0029C884FF|nr:TorF family putative porin [Thiomicrorhabdus sp.]